MGTGVGVASGEKKGDVGGMGVSVGGRGVLATSTGGDVGVAGIEVFVGTGVGVDEMSTLAVAVIIGWLVPTSSC